MRVGIFGGFFNPPHLGHVRAAKSASRALRLDTVLFIPSCVPPHKQIPEGTPPPEIRLEMAAAAAAQVKGGAVCDIEIARGGVSYTADTVRDIRLRFETDDIWLIVGSDMLLCIQNWQRPEVIFSSCAIAALARKYGDSGNINKHADVLRKDYGAKIDIIEHEPVEISSSGLRRMLTQGDGRYVPTGVFEIIKEHKLYGIR